MGTASCGESALPIIVIAWCAGRPNFHQHHQFTRFSSNGKTPAFQAGNAGSTPAGRSLPNPARVAHTDRPTGNPFGDGKWTETPGEAGPTRAERQAWQQVNSRTLVSSAASNRPPGQTVHSSALKGSRSLALWPGLEIGDWKCR